VGTEKCVKYGLLSVHCGSPLLRVFLCFDLQESSISIIVLLGDMIRTKTIISTHFCVAFV